ncbi:CHAT domain-containing protein [Leptolyngbya sp. DQ-M1]|uniref:CHAT domain-containing protein n=1 Tax=Leptolyngbya sp. DQ-M1 TaxID=2933920 RepID=UPI00329901D3
MNSAASPRKILILASNPKNTSHLRLDEEVREINEGLNRAKHRDQFELIQKWAVRSRDIHRALLDVVPNIVHFSGHGAGENGLVFEDESGQQKFVTKDALSGLFELFADQVECVVLNGCYSKVQAESIAQHIPYVIGMQQAIGDRAAISFAVGFYDALGAGRSFDFSYRLGCYAIQVEGIPEHLTPVLINKRNIEFESSIKQRIERKLKLPFFDNIIRLVQQRIESLSDRQIAYYVAILVSGIEERFALRDVEDFSDGKAFTFWFLMKVLLRLDLSRQSKIINHIEKQEYEHENLTMLAAYDLIEAAGGVLGEHYYQDGESKVPLDAGWELLGQVFSNDDFFAVVNTSLEDIEPPH